MAAYLRLQKECDQHLKQIFMVKRDVNKSRLTERHAAIKIQSWFRSLRVQLYIRYINRCAKCIQNAYRQYAGRIVYRRLIKERMNHLAKNHYDHMATVIQSRWRGYYFRKYKFDFYARKEYLAALLLKNDAVRRQIEAMKEERINQEELERRNDEESRETYTNRKTHYLLSTQVRRGIYNSPTRSSLDKENALASVSPFSKKERVLIEQSRQQAFLKTATGIPTSNEEHFINNSVKLITLPPLKDRIRPQGPFRSPSDVTRQRYKPLEPTLRVTTDYDSVEKARLRMREEEWTQRVIDQRFLPSTKRVQRYNPSLHTSTTYERLDYGNKHFRVTEDQMKPSKPFHRVVSPIPLFDQLGKTY